MEAAAIASKKGRSFYSIWAKANDKFARKHTTASEMVGREAAAIASSRG